MASATLDMEQSSPRRGWLPQLGITLFLGIPMTLALSVGIAFYCVYECVKFAFSSKTLRPQTGQTEEQSFTQNLTKMASIHGPTQAVNPVAEILDKPVGKEDSSITTASEKS